MLAQLAWYLRIAAQFVRIGLVRRSQFRIEFTFQVIMDCVWYAAHIGLFEVLYMHTSDIAGWNREQFRVLLGYLFVSDAFMMIWLGKMWTFGADLKDGKLDPVRVRPGPTFFLHAFRAFSVEGCFNMVIALTYLFYAIARALGGIAAGTLLLAGFGIVLCFWVRVVVVALLSAAEFWLLGSDVTRFLYDLLSATVDRPTDIFGARLRFLLLYIVPVGALTQIPANLVLGRVSPLYGAVASVWLLALGRLVFAIWNLSLRRYESAMG